jgi:hypothetical protein
MVALQTFIPVTHLTPSAFSFGNPGNQAADINIDVLETAIRSGLEVI